MSMRRGRLFLLACCAALLIALLSAPGAERLGLIGTVAAQETLDIDYFYDQLDPYGQWVWHPRFGYVWLPQTVSENWRPYTVGHWVYTDEYGWYWHSHEPFAWAVYHYGRWGYDPSYGWFWVPGDTWAPAWVEWRYGDRYVGWAPAGPTYGGGYAYGAPVSYEPPVAESWVFVDPRYVTSPSIDQYYVPIPRLNDAFFSATTVYRPDYRAGAIFNLGIPRETVEKFTNRPIIVEKIIKVQNQTNIDQASEGGIKVFAPSVANVKTERTPKRFIDSPSGFKPKAKLTATLEGAPPNGLGPTAATIKPITSEVGPEEFKKHVVHPGTSGTAQGQASIGPAEQGQASTESTPAGQGKPHLHGGPAMGSPGGSEGPGSPAGQGQASTEIAPTGPGKPHLKNTPALGGPQAPVGAAGQGQASTEIAPTGPGKPHLKNTPALGGPQAPVGAAGQGQASTEIAPTGPGKPHLKNTPALGGPPVGAAGQGQTSTEIAPTGPGKPHLAGAPSGQPTVKHPKHPECAQHPELPVCKDQQHQ